MLTTPLLCTTPILLERGFSRQQCNKIALEGYGGKAGGMTLKIAQPKIKVTTA